MSKQDQAAPADPLAWTTDDELTKMIGALEEAADTVRAYQLHRKAPLKAGVAKAPFNFKNFLTNFVEVYNVLAPLISQFSGVKLPPIPAGSVPTSTT